MPDIPLRSFGINNNNSNTNRGYSRLDSVPRSSSSTPTPRTPHTSNSTTGNGGMNRNVTRAAASSAAHSRNNRRGLGLERAGGRRTGLGFGRGGGPSRYVDDPTEEEEAIGLLEEGGIESGIESGLYEGDEQGMRLPDSASSKSRLTKSKSKTRTRKSDTSLISRTIPFRPSEALQKRYPANTIRNQKYNIWTFFPIVFWEQFKFFFNLYFLLVALSQFVPALKIGEPSFHYSLPKNIGSNDRSQDSSQHTSHHWLLYCQLQ